ncbi:MAG: hypothetical protein U9Q73_02205 [Nanoarchaeota archaeon]|nr:hypothetical protein [Nanoarchaeota archaeon]
MKKIIVISLFLFFVSISFASAEWVKFITVDGSPYEVKTDANDILRINSDGSWTYSSGGELPYGICYSGGCGISGANYQRMDKFADFPTPEQLGNSLSNWNVYCSNGGGGGWLARIFGRCPRGPNTGRGSNPNKPYSVIAHTEDYVILEFLDSPLGRSDWKLELSYNTVCECTLGTCCSNGCNYDAAGTFCDDTDHCVGETWHTGYGCDGTGSCTNHYGSQNKDNGESYCTSTGSGCTARTWFNNSCCGNDANEFYDGAGSCDGTHACCDSATDYVMNGICVSSCYLWENLNNEEISHANLGDTVRMTSEGVSPAEFKIYEEDLLLDDYITTVTGASEGGRVAAYWTITAEDLEKTGDYEEFYFEVDGDSEKRSGHLTISETYDNTPTVINLISPTCGTYFNAGPGIVNIILNASDDDDIIEGTLSINDLKVADFNNGDMTIGHIFSEGGNYKIVTEGISSRGKKSRAISNVMVIDTTVDGEYVAACITQPEDYSEIPISYVEFDASDSLGIRYSTLTGISEIGPSGLSFDWSFSDGRTNPHSLGTDELSYHFFKNFYSVGNNWATLQVSTI